MDDFINTNKEILKLGNRLITKISRAIKEDTEALKYIEEKTTLCEQYCAIIAQRNNRRYGIQ
jgi:translation elongation factor EF-Ts